MMGKVLEVFIPDNGINDLICFKVQLDDEIIDITQKQNKLNSKIYREDRVFVSYLDDLINIEKVNDGE